MILAVVIVLLFASATDEPLMQSAEPFVLNPRFCIQGTVGTGCELALTPC